MDNNYLKIPSTNTNDDSVIGSTSDKSLDWHHYNDKDSRGMEAGLIIGITSNMNKFW